MKTVLTIAGSDCSGGAGIQADIKTITAHKLYASSAITALTAQNTTGVYDIMEVSPDFLAQQLDCIFTDIFPDAIKIGMVASTDLIEVIADKLAQYRAKNIVLDPVMMSTSGSVLIRTDATDTLIALLFPLSDIITPNLSEAQCLSNMKIETPDQMIPAAKAIVDMCARGVLIKGGHLGGSADDLYFENGHAHWLRGDRVDTQNTHGTGCTLSSAIACNLALGMDKLQSIQNAKAYITGALQDGLSLGKGNGPLNHVFAL